MIKGLPPATPSKAFALWLALLLLYFLLLPSAAETSGRDAEISSSTVPSQATVSPTMSQFMPARVERRW